MVGPVKQIKNMFHPKRWLTSLVVIASLIGTLVVAIVVSDVKVGQLCMLCRQSSENKPATSTLNPQTKSVVGTLIMIRESYVLRCLFPLFLVLPFELI